MQMENKPVFINTLSRFHTNPENIALGKEKWGRYSFDIMNITEYNETTLGWTTVGLSDGHRWTVAITYNDFVKLIKKYFDIEDVIDSRAMYEFKEQK